VILALKVRLIPDKEQESKLWKSAGTARYVYNWALNRQIEHFENTGKLNKISNELLRKELTKLKQTKEFEWLYEVSNNVAKQAVKDLCLAIDRFHEESRKHGYRYRKSSIKSGKPLTFREFEDFPRFKSRKKSKISFYNDTDKLKIKEDEILIEKVGWIKLAETNRIPVNYKYTNPRISNDGKYWYISVGVEVSEPAAETTGISIGIDLGLKSLAVVSNIDQPYKNINKTKEVKRLNKKLKRKQKQVSRKYEKGKVLIGKEGENRYRFTKTNNIKRLEKEIKLIQRRISNIRLNHIHQTTAEIVKTKPSKIVVEDLNVKAMMKNKHLSKAVGEQCFHKFISILEYKSKFNGIEFIKADRFYPSSKTCSCCGDVKKDLKLKDRVFVCPTCNYRIDRDKNASINLSRYKKSA
jgi:putative transposase